MDVVEGPVVELVFLDGCGDEEAELKPIEDGSGLLITLFFSDWRFLAILRNL